MRISKKLRNAYLILSALKDKTEPLTSMQIAEMCDLPLPYTSSIIGELSRRGYVKSKRGPGGGYLPTEKLYDMKIEDLFNSVQEGFFQVVGNPTLQKFMIKFNSHLRNIGTSSIW